LGRGEGKDFVLADPSQVLSGLAEELKQLVTLVARQSEYLSNKQPNSRLDSIEQTAQSALRLIDSYLLYAQSEYGQQALPLQTYSAGSILYDVSAEVRSDRIANKQPVISAEDVGPIMCNKRALGVSLACLFRVIAGSSSGNDNIYLVSHRQRGGDIFAGVFSRKFSVKGAEIKRARELVGKSSMALTNQTYQNGVDLIIADGLARSQGSSLSSYKYKGMNGLGIKLFNSQQLSLV
jgi:light-regulated signal transduction histidine kinase (bacteriophytochrome)